MRNWSRHDDKVFVASLSEQGIDWFRFHQIFYRGQRQILARHPNYDPAHPQTGGLLYVDASSHRMRTGFHYAPGEIPLDVWQDISQAEVNLFPYNCWDHNIIPVTDVDSEFRYIQLRYPVAGRIHEANRYFVQNVRAAVDAPGEWCVDYETGKLYYYPPTGSVADDEVLVPVLENLVSLSGTAAEPIQHFCFHGFRLAYAEQDGVSLEGADTCEVTANQISQIGGVGINVGYLRNAQRGIGNRWIRAGRTKTRIHSGDRALLSSDLCRKCRVAGNDVHSTGGDGIVVIGSQNTADNNHLHQTGLYDMVSAAVTVYGHENIVSHNEIHDVPRDAIFINGARNIAEYNAVRNTMLYTADNAAIALRQHDVARAVRDSGNVIRFNKILDTVGYGSYPHCTYPPEGYGSPFCTWGIYLDGAICDVTVYGNVIARSGANSLYIQFGGGNIVENNIFVETLDKAFQYDSMLHFGWLMHSDPESKFPTQPNQIRRNIFCYTGKNKKLYLASLWGHPEWNEAQATFDHNLIWHQGLPVESAFDTKRTYRSFADWQAAGHDQHSLVADPRFVDAEHDDFRLQSDSPAFQLGFRNINEELAKIGPYASADRASWPLEDCVLEREQPVVFAYRKPPQAIVDGFELTPVGAPPAWGQVLTSGKASIVVDADLQSTGKKSLRFNDAQGLEQLYHPHLAYTLNYSTGKMQFSVDIHNAADHAAQWFMEFRDWNDQLLVGPTFAGQSDGTLTAGGKFGSGGTVLGRVPNGTWFNVSVEFEVGATAAKTYTLTVRAAGEDDRVFRELPFVDRAFSRWTWFGISCMSDADTVLHVDNLIMGPTFAAGIDQVLQSPWIQGWSRHGSRNTQMRNNDQLAVYWKFDEAKSYQLVDSSGNGLDGDLTGGTRAMGEFGRALYLDGSDAAAELEDNPLIQFGESDFTVECWVCPMTLAVDSPHQRRRLLDKGLYPDTWWNIDIGCDGRVRMEMIDSDKQQETTQSEGAVQEKEWSHLAIVVDRARFRTTYYINGMSDGVQQLPPGFKGRLDMAGKSLTSGIWQPFIGLLDELKIYRRALTGKEVAASYQATKSRYRSTQFTSEWD